MLNNKLVSSFLDTIHHLLMHSIKLQMVIKNYYLLHSKPGLRKKKHYQVSYPMKISLKRYSRNWMFIKKDFYWKKILYPFLVPIIGNRNKHTNLSKNWSVNSTISKMHSVVLMATNMRNLPIINLNSLSNNYLEIDLKKVILRTFGKTSLLEILPSHSPISNNE
jgi:hypothetical protein